MDFKNYKLKDNPFRISPVIEPEGIIWAGMKELQKNIDSRIEAAINTSPTRLILNWGRYGSGKTHAANFYTKTNYISKKFKKPTKNIKVTLPRAPKNPVQAFLRALVGQLNFDNIIDDFADFKMTFEKSADNIIEALTQDSIIAQLLQLFYSSDKNQQISIFGNVNDKQTIALKNYLFGDSSKDTLSKLNLPLGLEDDEQVVNLISGIFNTITYQKKLYNTVFLWIDEFEDIDTLPKSSQDRFTSFLRQLIDKTPNNLIIFLNFTLKGVRDLEDLSIVLGEALKSRTSINIAFESPDINEANNYLEELINNPRFRDKKDIQPDNLFYPFTKESIDLLLNNIGNLTIRKINETMSLVLELALLQSPVPGTIDQNFIDSVKSELINWKN